MEHLGASGGEDHTAQLGLRAVILRPGRGRCRARLPAQPPPPSLWKQPRRPGLLEPRPPRSLLLQGRVGWADPGLLLLPSPLPGRGREPSRRGSRRRALLPGDPSQSRLRLGARGDVSHEHDLDAVPRAAAAVDGTPGGRGAGRRATHSLCLRALPARGARPADGALRAHPTRPLQPHARLVLDRPQGGTRAWPVRLRVGLNHLTLGWPSIGSGPTSLLWGAGLLWGAAGPTTLWIPPQSPAQGGGHEKASPSSPRPLPYTQASAVIPPRKPEPHFVPFPALSSPPNSPIPTACR